MLRPRVLHALCCCGAVAAWADALAARADSPIIGTAQVVAARAEDTFMDLAWQFDLGFEELVAANPDLDPWLPPDGARVRLPTQHILPNVPRVGIVVNLAALRLFYFPRGQPRVFTYPIAVGRDDWPTPVGVTAVTARLRYPAWRVPHSIREEHAQEEDPLPRVVEAGPGNPLGKHALRLGWRGYLIHGTNRRYGIGMRLTHGCIRLYPADIAALFTRVPVGTPVRIIDQRYLAAWDEGVLYLEAHPPLEPGASDERALIDALIHPNGGAGRRPLTAAEWDRARAIAAQARGMPTPVTAEQPGQEYEIVRAR